ARGCAAARAPRGSTLRHCRYGSAATHVRLRIECAAATVYWRDPLRGAPLLSRGHRRGRGRTAPAANSRHDTRALAGAARCRRGRAACRPRGVLDRAAGAGPRPRSRAALWHTTGGDLWLDRDRADCPPPANAGAGVATMAEGLTLTRRRGDV